MKAIFPFGLKMYTTSAPSIKQNATKKINVTTPNYLLFGLQYPTHFNSRSYSLMISSCYSGFIVSISGFYSIFSSLFLGEDIY